MNINADLSGDDLSSTMDTETLLAHNLVPGALPTSSKGSAEHILGGEGYLAIDQSANRRRNFP